MGGESFLDGFPFFSRHLVPQNVGNIIFVGYFLNIGSESNKHNVLLTSPSNQFRDYFIWNRIEKLMPQHWNFPPQTLKTLKQLTNLFSNLDFLPKSGFPKTLDWCIGPQGSFMTKYLQIASWISRKAKGFWLKEPSAKIHLEK